MLSADFVFNKLQSTGQKPRFHGNGFVQLYLGEGKRLHIWSPDLPMIRDHNATMHNHRYDVHSTVIHGLLKHTVYDVVYEPLTGPYQMNVVNTSNPEDKPLSGPKGTGERYNLVKKGVYHMPKGSYYEFPYPLIHTSEADEFTITLFEQVNDDRSRHPFVLSPYGEAPTHAFDPATAPGLNRLWSVIYEACKRERAEIFEAWGVGQGLLRDLSKTA